VKKSKYAYIIAFRDSTYSLVCCEGLVFSSSEESKVKDYAKEFGWKLPPHDNKLKNLRLSEERIKELEYIYYP
jgi:hypothetical protein